MGLNQGFWMCLAQRGCRNGREFANIDIAANLVPMYTIRHEMAGWVK